MERNGEISNNLDSNSKESHIDESHYTLDGRSWGNVRALRLYMLLVPQRIGSLRKQNIPPPFIFLRLLYNVYM